MSTFDVNGHLHGDRGRYAPQHRAEAVADVVLDDGTTIDDVYATLEPAPTYRVNQYLTLPVGITEADHEEYRYDRCGQLAFVLHERTGWPVFVFADGYDWDNPPSFPGWVHAGLQTPDDRFLDISGVTDWGPQWDKWVGYVEEEAGEADIEEVDVNELVRTAGLVVTEDDRAAADRLLHAIGLGRFARP